MVNLEEIWDINILCVYLCTDASGAVVQKHLPGSAFILKWKESLRETLKNPQKQFKGQMAIKKNLDFLSIFSFKSTSCKRQFCNKIRSLSGSLRKESCDGTLTKLGTSDCRSAKRATLCSTPGSCLKLEKFACNCCLSVKCKIPNSSKNKEWTSELRESEVQN